MKFHWRSLIILPLTNETKNYTIFLARKNFPACFKVNYSKCGKIVEKSYYVLSPKAQEAILALFFHSFLLISECIMAWCTICSFGFFLVNFCISDTEKSKIWVFFFIKMLHDIIAIYSLWCTCNKKWPETTCFFIDKFVN